LQLRVVLGVQERQWLIRLAALLMLARKLGEASDDAGVLSLVAHTEGQRQRLGENSAQVRVVLVLRTMSRNTRPR
jgi:hypothetical protein